MSQTGQELVCNGALCQCDKGTLPSMLQVTSNQHVYLQGKLVATTQDKTFLPFGTCMLKNNLPCTPMLLWQDAFDLVSVDSPMSHPLLEKSTIMCSFGGKVSILLTLQIAVPGLPALPQVEGVRTAFMSLCPLLLNED
ncbi:DUF4280 domain-containing protein [Hymenobacter terrenus]|uniref:DUF4280 domain-containing protein n=1 Tax=Hymenobacter terrenus TaxID=1629124 RepID=UPI0006963129|nr:DUF4280 domain-containing protein [Hymenobacter terrenus]